jgi:hypothetical protein
LAASTTVAQKQTTTSQIVGAANAFLRTLGQSQLQHIVKAPNDDSERAHQSKRKLIIDPATEPLLNTALTICQLTANKIPLRDGK